MYSSSDFEHFHPLQSGGDAARGIHPELLFEKQSTLQSVSQMIQGYPTSYCFGIDR